LLWLATVELDLRQQVIRARRVERVLAGLQDLQRLARVARCCVAIALHRVQARLRPVNACGRERVARVVDVAEDATEQLLRCPELAAVDQRIGEEDREALDLDPVLTLTRELEVTLEDRDR
jgi:hypothetical protein